MGQAYYDDLVCGGLRRYYILWGVNGFFLLAFLAVGFLVDGNGELPGLNEDLSCVVAVAMSAGAIPAAVAMILKGLGGQRWLGVTLATFYVAILCLSLVS